MSPSTNIVPPLVLGPKTFLLPPEKPGHWMFFVEGVRCSKCITKIESLPQSHPELMEVRFQQGNSSIKVELAPEAFEKNPDFSISLFQSWLAEKGFKSYLTQSNEDLEIQRKKTHRSWLIQIAVTFFFAANIMMAASSLYTGADAQWRPLFSWLCGILFIPVAVFSAQPFYVSAWQSIKDRRFSADVAIVIAFGWGAILSYFNLFRGSTDFYFDSNASFIFLIILTRYFLYRAQSQFEMDLNPSHMFKESPFFEVRQNSQSKPTTKLYNQIDNGTLVSVGQNQLIPIDGLLLSDFAELDTSLFSGESVSQTFYKNQSLKAGMVVKSESLEVLCEQKFEQTELSKLFQEILNNKKIKTKAQSRAEIYSQYLLTTVSALSLLTITYFYFIGHLEEGFHRALALFTIACPCALAFAIPLASVTVIKRAAQLGLLAKNPLFFEKLLEVQTVAFDKTGTLTKGSLEFAKWRPNNISSKEPSQEEKEILLTLEHKAHHPMAKALTQKLFAEGVQILACAGYKEIPGVGVEATINGILYRVQRIGLEHEGDSTLLWKPGFSLLEIGPAPRELLRAYFTDQLRPETKPIVDWLARRSLNIKILSGDRSTVVTHIAGELGLALRNIKAELSPDEKQEYIKTLTQTTSTLMVGDGHNDSLALSAATTSIAVSGSAETCLQAADVYSRLPGLHCLPKAFELAYFYQDLIRQNITLSLMYNTLAGAAAILGWVHPLAAAILMPINSIIVIGATKIAKPRKSIILPQRIA